MKVPSLQRNRAANLALDGGKTSIHEWRWSVADINVERRGPSIWPWIVGLIVLALLIWALVEMFGRTSEPVVRGTTADTVIVDSPTVGAPPPPPVPGATTAPPPGEIFDTVGAGFPRDTI
jgi:hypothetical protein